MSHRNLVGKFFGKLEVIEVAPHRAPDGHLLWKCLCLCGNECFCKTSHLLSKRGTKSCGCLRRKNAIERGRSVAEKRAIDITGKRFNRLVAIEQSDIASSRRGSKWLFLCDCGKTISLFKKDVTTNNTKSCGCLKIETGSLLGKTFGSKNGSKVIRKIGMDRLKRIRMSKGLDQDTIISTEDNRERKKFHESELRDNCYKRDGYTCVICQNNKGTGMLNAHHVFPWVHFTEKRFCVKNLVTLCKICHRKIHSGKNNKFNVDPIMTEKLKLYLQSIYGGEV